ncbi:tryptophan--tRNA ligase [Candidatus Kaiserbacteria bacterium RIFCSPHIGHO2_01_FULL_55_17]|uniref:Tryptophan--tRNA ligase n=1 Tax=Candidatus Kaiserbacteria bacterium RIFCSPHIGHO2_01_FULL_55_17 TaxID=1798484 RepID=A0A1F6D8V4_9BACT|nr:MAG: tryptophan--tRNA ligase [Candidatus Kaiserbacteria bacterium RIFCSPHIGHO2_01_FULL_55_17]
MQRLFTGLQPSGALHIGNYFGVLKQTAEMLKDADGLVMVADYHALTTLKEPEELRKNIMNVVRDYVAVGVDPAKAVIFQQSDVPEHTELTWIFNTLVTMSFLELAHAYKDKEARGLETNVGLFDYPVLMACDILLYDTDVVPVGADQKQHVEYAREIAAKFNNTFGATFKEPKEKILPTVAIVPGTDGKKMSKSYGNTIPLFGTKAEVQKAVMSIVTDSKGERPENVYAIHKLFRSESELATLYEKNKGNYKALKEALATDIEALIGPMREKRDSISDADVKKILKDGGERARAQASAKMKDVRKKIGVTI